MNKTILITGGNRGIGAAVSRALTYTISAKHYNFYAQTLRVSGKTSGVLSPTLRVLIATLFL